MTVTATKKRVIAAQRCTITFTFAAAVKSFAGQFAFAKNPVSHTCDTDPIPVQRKLYMLLCYVI